MQSDMPYFDSEYARCPPNHFGCRSSGGESVRICGFAAFCRYGRHAREVRNVPRVLIC